jgi:hypothetical protein
MEHGHAGGFRRPADFGRFVANDIEKWGKVVKFAGLKPD